MDNVKDSGILLADNESYMCCLHEDPRTFSWCEDNCGVYYGCDTVAAADHDLNLRENPPASRHLLITVIERDIYTEAFDSRQEAYDRMKDEFEKNVREGHQNDEDELNKLDEYLKDPLDSTVFPDGYFLGDDTAWSNVRSNNSYDWKIVQI